jgi:hypothetical protein
MLGMLGFLDDFQQLTVAPWPAAIFGWAGSFTIDAASITDTWLGIQHFLQRD